MRLKCKTSKKETTETRHVTQIAKMKEIHTMDKSTSTFSFFLFTIALALICRISVWLKTFHVDPVLTCSFLIPKKSTDQRSYKQELPEFETARCEGFTISQA